MMGLTFVIGIQIKGMMLSHGRVLAVDRDHTCDVVPLAICSREAGPVVCYLALVLHH